MSSQQWRTVRMVTLGCALVFLAMLPGLSDLERLLLDGAGFIAVVTA